jgi:hypothetical protein
LYRFHITQLVKVSRMVDVEAETEDEAFEILDDIPFDEGMVIDEDELDYDIDYFEALDDD